MGQKKVYHCRECGSQATKWQGRCNACDAWNSFVEVEDHQLTQRQKQKTFSNDSHDNRPQRLQEIKEDACKRHLSGIGEVDRVLGGGIVPGAFMLLGGDPGIGKSTLALQIANRLAKQKQKVLYVTGEESLQQTKMRASRLAIDADALFILSETQLEVIKRHALTLKPTFLIIDSIQTIFSSTIDSTPGSVGQIRECAADLMFFSKSNAIATFIIGHVTKEGQVAGPRMLEHLVDTVLYFEGQAEGQYRILRAVKNRFGSTNEIGVFEMKTEGLIEVENPSAHFLANRNPHSAGSGVIVIMEGSRPLLVEIQALVSTTSFGYPRRNALGIELSRLNMLVAVMEKKLAYNLANQDIFANIAGGLKIHDPSADLGVVSAIASSFLNRPLPSDVIMLGEIGLVGEIRAVNYIESRVAEAVKMGFKRIVLPKSRVSAVPKGTGVIAVATVEEAFSALFS